MLFLEARGTRTFFILTRDQSCSSLRSVMLQQQTSFSSSDGNGNLEARCEAATEAEPARMSFYSRDGNDTAVAI